MNQLELNWPAGGGKMGELIRAHDWSATELGAIPAWPQCLKTAADIVLRLPVPAMLMWGRQGVLLYNDGFAEFAGALHPGLLGARVLEAWPAHAEFHVRVLDAGLAGKSLVYRDQEFTLHRRGRAEQVWADLDYVPVPDADSNPAGVLGILAETTEKILAEKALRNSEERFRRALQIDTVGVIFFKPDGEITEANHAFLRMSGFCRQDVEAGQLRWDRLTPPEWMPQSRRAIEEFMACGQTTPYEKEYFRKDGTRFWALFAAKRLSQDEGVEYVLDITERKRAEQALRESEARFRALAEASPALIWQVDANGDAVYLNQRYCDLVGRTPGEILGSGWHAIMHPDDAPVYMAAFEKALRERIRFQHRVRAGNRDGGWQWLESHALPWFTADGEYAGHVGISIDITEAAQAEQALKEADRRKDEFLATLAHELRNPLAPICNAMPLIGRPGGVRRADRLHGMMERQVKHIVRLVDDLMEVSRITRGKIELRKEPADLADIVRSAIETSRPLIDGAGQRLSVILPDEPLLLDADVVRLTQVFANLLNNASKYTAKGGDIRLRARREGGQALVSVRDNGIGISPEMLPRVFDIFAQEHRSADRGQGGLGGLGIGLTLACNLVRMHDGSMEARSEGQGRGSEFIVRLPLLPIAHADPRPAAENQAAALSRRRILAVDDNQDAADTLAMLLNHLGAEVRVANDGQAALALLEAWRPDMILLDIGMPGMDGYEVARRIRQQLQYQDIKLIALTGWGQEDDRRRSRDSGFDHHLTKPVDLNALEALLFSPLQPAVAGAAPEIADRK
jgi:PAS domain S-box-containing protein